MSRKLTETEFIERDAKREVWNEAGDGIREIKAGRIGRKYTSESYPVVRARENCGLTQSEFAQLLGVSIRATRLGARTAQTIERGAVAFVDRREKAESVEGGFQGIAESPTRRDVFYINQLFLDSYEEAFEKGDPAALLPVIWCCALDGVPLPEWASKAFVNAYEGCVGGDAKSWDDVFGKPHLKGSNLNAIKKRHEKRGAVANRIKQMKADDPKIAIDAALFEQVGAEFHIGKTLAAEYYYEVKKWAERWGAW